MSEKEGFKISRHATPLLYYRELNQFPGKSSLPETASVFIYRYTKTVAVVMDKAIEGLITYIVFGLICICIYMIELWRHWRARIARGGSGDPTDPFVV